MHWLITFLLLIALFGTYDLVIDEFSLGYKCPKILGIPACYIVFCCFLMALIFQWLKGKATRILYFCFVGLVSSIALYGTIGELVGFAKCPRTSSGIPMCFISLTICVLLLMAKWQYVRKT